MTSTAPARRRPGPSAAAATVAAVPMALLALLLVLFAVPQAHAAPAPAEDRKSTFGVQPAGPKEPDTRAHFSYGVTGGAGLRDQIAVWNYGDEPLTVAVYASDAVNTADGGFDLLPAGQAPKDAGSWIKLEKDTVTVPPKANVIVPFTLAVPRDATPGDHTAGIVATLAAGGQDAQGNKVRLDQRVGTRVYLRLAGELTPRLAVEDVKASYAGTPNPFGTGSATVTYTLRNTGNVRLGARQAVRINGMLGGSVTEGGLKDLGDLLPGSSLTITAKADGVRPALRSSAVVSVQAVATREGVDPKLPSLTRSASLWTVPWTLLALVLATTACGLWLWRRRRLARAAATASARRRTTPEIVEKEPIVHFTRPSRRDAAGAAVLVAAVVTLAAAALPGAAAEAAQAGTAVINPATGTDTTSVDLATSAACPAPATNVLVKVTGKGFPAEGKNVVGNSPISTYGQAPSGGIVIPLTMTMRDYANEAGFTTLEGRYDLTVVCRKSFGSETYGDFTGSMWFTSNTEYRTTDPGGGQPTPTPTRTATSSATPTPTPTSTQTSTPTPTPTTTSTPDPSATPTPTTTATATGGTGLGLSTNVTTGGAGTAAGGTAGTSGSGATGGSGSGKGGGLANTGTDAVTLALIAAGLVLTGGSAVWWARRRGLLSFPGASGTPGN
ncbi:WxL protein peptidoglycan domain-containing protein [Streptomyces sp. NPDC091682]|uniref:WxL protein peptidoglycan domain-containing protein n=1 Tax=Streptomyces sp. NPDC091682 TaxID=3366005 RepID=UPI00382DB374